MNPVVRIATSLLLVLGALFAPRVACAVDSGDIVVVSIKGEVHLNVNGAARTLRAGSVLELPATLRTGRNGAVELRQGETTLSVGPETLLEFPALEKRGAPIDRIVQPRGNVFYNIGKREGRKLRIETPFLVGVVKGTQFNVAAQDEATTISLFEGLLEVRAADDSSVVDLRAGEIASRQRDDQAISVLKMDAGKAPAVTPRQPAGSGSNGGAPSPSSPRATPRNHDRDSILVDRDVADPLSSPAASVGVGASLSNDDPVSSPSDSVAVSVDTGVAVSVSGPDVSTSTTVDAVPVSVESGVAVNVSGPVDVSAPTSVDAGPISVDTGVAVNVSGPVDVSTPTTVDTGPISVDVGTSTVDTGVTAGVDTGPITTDVDAGVAVDLETGDERFTVINGSSRNQVEVTVGSETAAEAVAGNNGHGNDIDHGNNIGPGNSVSLDLGVDLGAALGVDLGVDVNAGVDDGATTPPADVSGTDKPGHGPPADVLELLDGLVRRPGRK